MDLEERVEKVHVAKYDNPPASLRVAHMLAVRIRGRCVMGSLKGASVDLMAYHTKGHTNGTQRAWPMLHHAWRHPTALPRKREIGRCGQTVDTLGLDAPVDVEFVVDRPNVRANGIKAHFKVRGDLFVQSTLTQHS